MSFAGSVNRLSARDFQTVRQIVYDSIGVNLTEAKKALVISRLSKRLRELKMQDFAQYFQFLHENPAETEIMFNYLTTNVTKFFREKHHFEYLFREYLPHWESRSENSLVKKRIRAWSAGCSTGEEPYTLAMVLLDYFKNKKDWSVNILASDVNTAVLKKAYAGIYARQEVEGIPYNSLKKYFKLGVKTNTGFFKVKKILQKIISFQQINLVSPEKFPAAGSLNMIFCRNVFIYFDLEVRRKILERFHRSLLPGGLLFLGHSESINTLDDKNGQWRVCRHTVYEKIP